MPGWRYNTLDDRLCKGTAVCFCLHLADTTVGACRERVFAARLSQTAGHCIIRGVFIEGVAPLSGKQGD